MFLKIKREDLDESSFKALCAILSCPTDSDLVRLDCNKVEYERRADKKDEIHS